MSNLFSCLWFNEVDRFTPRDQLSFAYTYLKLRRMNPGKLFHLNMFKVCAFTILHRVPSWLYLSTPVDLFCPVSSIDSEQFSMVRTARGEQWQNCSITEQKRRGTCIPTQQNEKLYTRADRKKRTSFKEAAYTTFSMDRWKLSISESRYTAWSSMLLFMKHFDAKFRLQMPSLLHRHWPAFRL